MRTIAAVVSFCLVLAAPLDLRADEAANGETVALAKSFAKICLLELPNFESVILRAKIEGWKQVEGPQREPILSATSGPTSSAWLTKGVDDLQVAVSVTRRIDTTIRRQVWTCAVQNPEVSTKGMERVLTDLLSLPEPTPEAIDGGRTLVKWQIRYGAQLVDIALVTETGGKPGVILNAIQFRGTP